MTDTEQTGTDPTGEQTTDVNADDHDVDPGRAAREEQPHDPAEAVRKARSDAASYRRRLREVEAERDALAGERDTLRGQVAARQRADVENLATQLPQALKDGTDLWTVTDLDALLGDDGDIDEAKVTEAVKALTTAKPHWAKSPGSFDLGLRGSLALTQARPSPTYSEAGRLPGGGKGVTRPSQRRETLGPSALSPEKPRRP